MSTPRSKPLGRGLPRDEISKGSAVQIPLPPPDATNAKLFPSVPASEDYMLSSSPSRSVDPSPIDKHGPSAAGGFDSQKRAIERSLGLPSSLPDSSPLSNVQVFQPDASVPGVQRANSELGHYPDIQDSRPNRNKNQRHPSAEQHKTRDEGRKSLYPTALSTAASTAGAPPDRVPSPEKQLDGNGKVKISGPMNGAPIPSGFKFGGKEVSSADQAANDRREKAKSRSFWGFGKTNGKDPFFRSWAKAACLFN
jgi:RalA-binding protein 1